MMWCSTCTHCWLLLACSASLALSLSLFKCKLLTLLDNSKIYSLSRGWASKVFSPYLGRKEREMKINYCWQINLTLPPSHHATSLLPLICMKIYAESKIFNLWCFASGGDTRSSSRNGGGYTAIVVSFWISSCKLFIFFIFSWVMMSSERESTSYGS